jgi:hypothetical protein
MTAVLNWVLQWTPHICVATMMTASLGSGMQHDWNKCVFWALDAAITGWSAFMLI